MEAIVRSWRVSAFGTLRQPSARWPCAGQAAGGQAWTTGARGVDGTTPAGLPSEGRKEGGDNQGTNSAASRGKPPVSAAAAARGGRFAGGGRKRHDEKALTKGRGGGERCDKGAAMGRRRPEP